MGVITMTPTVLLLITLCSVSTLAIDLFTFVSDPEVSTDKIAPCHSEDILSCTVVQINFAALDEQSLSLPRDCTVTFVDSPQEDSFYFESEDGTEATFTRGKSNNLIGNVLYSDGRDFTLEPCKAFKGCHVWMEEDETHWVDEESVPETDEERKNAKVKNRQATSALIQQGKDDSTTVVTYSVMFYYTPEFASITDDIPLFVSQVIAETNQGYINSGIPLRIRSHCIAAATLHDHPHYITMINEFSQYKPIDELRNSADAAALLVKKFDSCGVAKTDTFESGNTVSVTQKSCALGYFSFGHEIGHNFGCMPDARQGPNRYYSYGLGKHITSSPGVRTIMAYNAPGHRTRVNWWSNPDVKYQGVASGTSGENNARVLREHRFAFAAIGDESNACGSTTPTVPPTTGTSGELKSPNYPSEYPNKFDKTDNIEVAEGKTIKIKFTAFNVESHSSCRYDWVQIIDGDSTVLLSKTCGTTIPAEIRSKTNKVKVIFHTDHSETRSGWKLTWSLASTGGGSNSGVVKSENYPSKYPNKLDKTYPVEVASGKRIKITFNDIEIESHRRCAFDYVMIKDGDGSTLLSKTCGTNKPADVTSRTNKVNIIFHTDHIETKIGFKLTWTEV